jgi:hypothetical protein
LELQYSDITNSYKPIKGRVQSTNPEEHKNKISQFNFLLESCVLSLKSLADISTGSDSNLKSYFFFSPAAGSNKSSQPPHELSGTEKYIKSLFCLKIIFNLLSDVNPSLHLFNINVFFLFMFSLLFSIEF